MGILFIVLIVIVLFMFWLSQMVALMSMKDDEFPGQHDKTLWFVAILIGSAAGALAFLLWRFIRTDDAMSDLIAEDIVGLIGKSREQEEADENRG
jgi:hypothetical protein